MYSFLLLLSNFKSYIIYLLLVCHYMEIHDSLIKATFLTFLVMDTFFYVLEL